MTSIKKFLLAEVESPAGKTASRALLAFIVFVASDVLRNLAG